jgi:hypothetical protein
MILNIEKVLKNLEQEAYKGKKYLKIYLIDTLSRRIEDMIVKIMAITL